MDEETNKFYKTTDYTKATGYSRTFFYLKQALAAELKRRDQLRKKLFNELLERAGKRRLNVSNVEKIGFKE